MRTAVRLQSTCPHQTFSLSPNSCVLSRCVLGLSSSFVWAERSFLQASGNPESRSVVVFFCRNGQARRHLQSALCMRATSWLPKTVSPIMRSAFCYFATVGGDTVEVCTLLCGRDRNKIFSGVANTCLDRGLETLHATYQTKPKIIINSSPPDMALSHPP